MAWFDFFNQKPNWETIEAKHVLEQNNIMPKFALWLNLGRDWSPKNFYVQEVIPRKKDWDAVRYRIHIWTHNSHLFHFGVELGVLLLIRQPRREVWNCSRHQWRKKAIILDCFPFCCTEHQEETLLVSSCFLESPGRALPQGCFLTAALLTIESYTVKHKKLVHLSCLAIWSVKVQPCSHKLHKTLSILLLIRLWFFSSLSSTQPAY